MKVPEGYLVLNCMGQSTGNMACFWASWSVRFVQGGNLPYLVGNAIGWEIFRQTYNYAIKDAKDIAVLEGTGLTGLGAGVVAADISAVEEGEIFGTRANGNYPLLNSADELRIGWSYSWRTGEYVFRIGGELLEKFMENPHINLWPPSWWFGPP